MLERLPAIEQAREKREKIVRNTESTAVSYISTLFENSLQNDIVIIGMH